MIAVSVQDSRNWFMIGWTLDQRIATKTKFVCGALLEGTGHERCQVLEAEVLGVPRCEGVGGWCRESQIHAEHCLN